MESSREPGRSQPTAADQALARLLAQLKSRGYRFVTPTPATHARVVKRPAMQQARDLRGVLGWSLAFDTDILEPEVLETLMAADGLEPAGKGRFKSRFRVSSLGEDLYLHSAFPTDEEDAVFFGPDSYRFAHLISAELASRPAADGARLVDVGAGAGVGGIVAAKACVSLRVAMTDINPLALWLARINAEAAGVEASFHLGPSLEPIDGAVDLILANPPYMIDTSGRDYRDGGDMHGAEIACEIAKDAVARLAPDGRFILYTGSAIIDGTDPLAQALTRLAEGADCELRYWEIDPDVFGEDLAKEPYRDVERIAVVGAVMTRRG
jgi:methylase of polypeptide subunit release factors